jgi:hypothetical protein
LKEVGFQANRRLLTVQKCVHDCSIGETAFNQMQQPSKSQGQRVSALRFGEPRAQAILTTLLPFCLHARSFTNAELKRHLAHMLGSSLESFPPGRMSYELRRLRIRGLIKRIPKTHRYLITPFGLRAALFYARLHAHIFRPALSSIMPGALPGDSRLSSTFNALDRAIADHARTLAA